MKMSAMAGAKGDPVAICDFTRAFQLIENLFWFLLLESLLIVILV